MNLMGKKHSYYGNQFPRFSTYSGFVGFSREPISQVFPIRRVFLPFPMLWEIDEKTLTFPLWWSILQDGNIMGKSAHSMEKVWEPFSQVFPIRWVSLTFLMLWENWLENTCISHVIKYTIKWESNGKKAPILRQNYEYQFPRFSPYFLLHFPVLWEIDGETHAFSRWWSRP